MDLMSGSRPKPEAEAAGALDHRLLDMLAHAANDFIALPSSGIGDIIDRTPREIGEPFAVDRAHLFEISADGRLMSNTHEWCGQGVQPEKANPQDVPTTLCPWWMGTLQGGGTINLRSLDDFGTSYSSLTYLKRPPTASLKIDQSFVANMLHDDGDRAIVTGVIELARVFGRASIAEGVETPAHMHSLRELGCDMAQGFGIAAAMPEDRFVDWCRRWPERQTAVMGLGGTS
jgi:hypothetical protein